MENTFNLQIQAAFEETQIAYFSMVLDKEQKKAWPTIEFHLPHEMKQQRFAFKAAFIGVKPEATYQLTMAILDDQDTPLINFVQTIKGHDMLRTAIEEGKEDPSVAYLLGETAPLPLRPGQTTLVTTLQLKHIETNFSTQTESWFIVFNQNTDESKVPNGNK